MSHKITEPNPPVEYSLKTFICHSRGQTLDAIHPEYFTYCPFCGVGLK